MMSSMVRLRLFWHVLFVSMIALSRFSGALGSQNSEEAYVTLFYGDEFLLGVRVLGKSVRDTASTRDMVALVSDGISDYAKKLLQENCLEDEKIKLGSEERKALISSQPISAVKNPDCKPQSRCNESPLPKLLPGKGIFIEDKAFCSADDRCRHVYVEEEESAKSGCTTEYTYFLFGRKPKE